MLYREALGYAVRTARLSQGKTLRDISASAPMALGYLSEVERGQKELSSEFVEHLAVALGMMPSELIRLTAEVLADWEAQEVDEVQEEIDRLTAELDRLTQLTK
jgi:transcriptional regulator with XRE-family HTH domain